jgi:hypothetical protein
MKSNSLKTKKSPLHGVKTGFLPVEHHFAHAFCFFLHDLIVQTLTEGEKAKIFNIIIRKKSNQKTPSSGEDLICWLETNGYKNEALMLLFKQIIRAMIADFGHFTYEALDCSQKGKLSVTFALLRKAFKDHLIYFEWLLADPKDFMEIFKDGKVNNLALDRNTEKKKEIINKAMNKLRSYWGSPEFLYEIRYDKKSQCSFESMWQQANHLITLCKEFTTTPMTFNFIFSTNEDMEKQWDILYTLLPILLIHTYHIIEKLFKQFAKRKNEEIDITDLKIMMGFFLLQTQERKNKTVPNTFKNVFSYIGLDKIFCPTCTSYLKFTKKNMMSFYEKGLVKCIKCKTEANLKDKNLSASLVELFNNMSVWAA